MEKFNVLIMGNNPIELSYVSDSLRNVKERAVETEFVFDIQGIQKKVSRFNPNYILIDDNVGTEILQKTVNSLTHNRKTKDIPITVIKNSNYIETINSGVMNYVLKQTLSPDTLYHALRNSHRIKRTQAYLLTAYRKRSGQLQQMVNKWLLN